MLQYIYSITILFIYSHQLSFSSVNNKGDGGGEGIVWGDVGYSMCNNEGELKLVKLVEELKLVVEFVLNCKRGKEGVGNLFIKEWKFVMLQKCEIVDNTEAAKS